METRANYVLIGLFTLAVIVGYIARVTARPAFARAAKIDAGLLAAQNPA